MKHNNPSHLEFSKASIFGTKNEFGSNLVHNQPIIVSIENHGEHVDLEHFKKEEQERAFIKIKDMDFETRKFSGELEFVSGTKKSILGKVDFEQQKVDFSIIGYYNEPVLNGHI